MPQLTREGRSRPEEAPTDINILVVEDNPIDARLIRMALQRAGFTKDPMVVDDGEPALALLRREQEYQDFPVPDLVILDLNLKRVDGPEVLEHIRETEKLTKLCVAILSSSPTDVMIQRAAQADGYFQKPSELDGFVRVGQQIRNCYQQCLEEPDRERGKLH